MFSIISFQGLKFKFFIKDFHVHKEEGNNEENVATKEKIQSLLKIHKNKTTN